MILKTENELTDKGRKSLNYFKHFYNDMKNKINI